MNILHLYKDYFPVLGGMENHIRWLAEAQAAAGHRVGVLVTSLDRRSSVRWENGCLLYTSPSPRDRTRSRMPSSA